MCWALHDDDAAILPVSVGHFLRSLSSVWFSPSHRVDQVDVVVGVAGDVLHAVFKQSSDDVLVRRR